MRLFWSMTRHVDRLRAADDLRSLTIMTIAGASVQGGQDASKELREQLLEQMGTVVRHRERATAPEDIRRILAEIG